VDRAAVVIFSQQSVVRTCAAQLASSLLAPVSQQHFATTRFIMWQKNRVRPTALPGSNTARTVSTAINWSRKGRMLASELYHAERHFAGLAGY
jgi:hypothetical protein